MRHHVSYRLSDPVLCLGVPDIYLTEAELRAAAAQLERNQVH